MDVDVERRQWEIIEYFSKLAAVLEGSPSSIAALILEATSHPSLFVFSEILSLPNLAMLEGTRYSTSVNVLRLFAYGTWSDYICNVFDLPTLLPDQVRKLKQLTVLTLAETEKALPYDQLMQEIDVSNVRELEDFLINECIYAGIIRGKLDQVHRRFEVQFAAGRDLRPEQLGNMIQTLDNWLGNSDNLQHLNQENIKWADTMNEVNKKHRVEIEDKINDVRTSIKVKLELQGHDVESGRIMDYEEDLVRPKRRRQLMS